MKAFIPSLLLLNIVCCHENKKEVSIINKEVSEIQKLNFQQMKYINPEEVKSWTLEQVKEKYKPIAEEEFLLNNTPISEFRIGLYNIFKGKDREKSIPIKEVTWEKDSETNYTIWYKNDSNRWIPIDYFSWGKDWVF